MEGFELPAILVHEGCGGQLVHYGMEKELTCQKCDKKGTAASIKRTHMQVELEMEIQLVELKIAP